MPRLVLAAIVSVLLLGFSAWSVVTTWVYPTNAPLKGTCDGWLERPVARWVVLKGCVLDADLVIVESDQGDYEKLANRQKGLSLKPYPAPPTWVAAWLPVRTELMGSGLVKAAYRLESDDLMKWINKLERADEREKERMWADPLPLRRLSRPGVLPGKADKPATEALRKALGAAASANLLAVVPGEPPVSTAPTGGLLAGLLGLVGLGWAIRGANRRGSAHLREATAEQHLTQVNVSDVKLELGALEELRAEERTAKGNRKID